MHQNTNARIDYVERTCLHIVAVQMCAIKLARSGRFSEASALKLLAEVVQGAAVIADAVEILDGITLPDLGFSTHLFESP